MAAAVVHSPLAAARGGAFSEFVTSDADAQSAGRRGCGRSRAPPPVVP